MSNASHPAPTDAHVYTVMLSGVDLKHEAAATIPGASLNIKDALDAGGAVTAAAVRGPGPTIGVSDSCSSL